MNNKTQKDPRLLVHYMGFGQTACMRDGLPREWPAGECWDNQWENVNCPECLKGREPIDTFTIAADGKSITCKRCKRTSYNPKDVTEHYCGACHVYHDDLWPPARAWWIANPEPHMALRDAARIPKSP